MFLGVSKSEVGIIKSTRNGTRLRGPARQACGEGRKAGAQQAGRGNVMTNNACDTRPNTKDVKKRFFGYIGRVFNLVAQKLACAARVVQRDYASWEQRERCVVKVASLCVRLCRGDFTLKYFKYVVRQEHNEMTISLACWKYDSSHIKVNNIVVKISQKINS